MSKIVSEEPRGNMQLRWLDPQVIEFLEALPRFGKGVIHIVDGYPTRKFTIEEDFLYTAEARKRHE